MRAALLLLVACGKSTELPPKPDIKDMGPEQRCLATAPRGTMCGDELMIGELQGLGGDAELSAKVAEEIAATPASKKEALVMHRTRCLGGAMYAEGLVRCWDQPDCKALAACVYATKH